ncbi:MAG: hypothetical protein AB7E80_08955 [Hyphomicrobiaceae bacterium]
MTHADYTLRIARSTAEAASGYANAAFAAYAGFARQSIDFWSDTLEAMVPKAEEPRSWYREPRQHVSTQVFNPWVAFSESFWPGMRNGQFAAMPAATFNPFMAWMRAFPLQGPPACWPMAFVMMGWGVPRDVAYPAAKANTAMIDAVKATAKVVEESFASYRTDSGYATAQVRFSSGARSSSNLAWPMAAATLTAPWMAPWLGFAA